MQVQPVQGLIPELQILRRLRALVNIFNAQQTPPAVSICQAAGLQGRQQMPHMQRATRAGSKARCHLRFLQHGGVYQN